MHAYNANQSNLDFHNFELDEFDSQAVRFKPESLDNLLRLTKFTRRELKLMYRGFKQLCPSGVVREDKFRLIYAQFFPRGAETSAYAKLVFNSFSLQLDANRKPEMTFTDFVLGLSVLLRGELDEQLAWIFGLYDINGDGFISRDELAKIVAAVHDLMGKFALSSPPEPPEATPLAAPPGDAREGGLQASVDAKVEHLLRKFDLDGDGLISPDDFLKVCRQDENIIKSISVFNSIL